MTESIVDNIKFHYLVSSEVNFHRQKPIIPDKILTTKTLLFSLENLLTE